MENELDVVVQKLAGGREFTPYFFLRDAIDAMTACTWKNPMYDFGFAGTDYEDGKVIVFDRCGRKYATLDEWYAARGPKLLGTDTLPPLSSQLCYGDKITHLDYRGIQMVLASAPPIGAGAGAGAAPAAAPASPTPLQAACAAFGAARTRTTELRKELQALQMQALQMQGTSVDNLTALIAKAEALKAALESMKPLSIRFVELCVSAGHLRDLDEMYIVEELAEVLEGKMKRE